MKNNLAAGSSSDSTKEESKDGAKSTVLKSKTYDQKPVQGQQ